jgi:hypothetical protein
MWKNTEISNNRNDARHLSAARRLSRLCKFLVLLGALAFWQAKAQITNGFQAWVTTSNAAPFEVLTMLPESENSFLTMTNHFDFQTERPNEITNGNMSFSGIFVETVKTRRPLQLLNPLAPPEFGSPEDNLVRDMNTKRILGLKFFEIRF